MGRFTRAIVTLMTATSYVNGGQQATDPPTDPPEQASITPAGWQTLFDSRSGFAIAYPPDFIVLPEPAVAVPRGGVRPTAARRVRFQQQEIAAGPFADREPAKLAIDVFEKDQRQTLREWLEAAGRLPQGATVSPARLAGAPDALRVRIRQLLAPNEFVYVASPSRVYFLIPLGERAEQMLSTFRFVGP